MDSLSRLTTALSDRYAIERELGAGGMAMVYLARDLRHERRVALKVLRPELAAVIGAERFLAEIRTTANLQHPHILPLHDSGEAGDIVFYVMPFVEGETLRDRLTREKQLPVEDALRITREVAGALDYAHRHGVIHRDIKPENILLHDGSALVADFGIALAVSTAGGSTRMTETGMSLGTPHYMSPEQAMGERELSPRSDVYALGCVLYEMLVGEPPFTGPTAQAIVAKVITEKPPLATAARESVPRHVARAIQKSLAKLPADRFASAAELSMALTRPGMTEELEAEPGLAQAPAPSRKLVFGLGALVVLLGGAALWGWLRPEHPRRVTASYIKVPAAEAPPPGGMLGDFAPDGSALVYLGPPENGVQRLWLKPRGELHARPLVGTEHANAPFFSPDGRWVAFFVADKLKKVPVEGGGVVTLAEAPTAFQWGGWLDDGRIVFAGPRFSLQMIGEAGGTAQTVVDGNHIPGRGAVGAIALPGSRGVLFAACGINCAVSDLWVLDLKTGKSKQVLSNVLNALYVATGHLLYSSGDGQFLAAPFDLGSLTVKGPGVPVVEGLARFSGITVTRDGTLFYQEGSAQGGGTAAWVSRDGRSTPIDSSWSGDFNSIALSPDGRRLAFTLVKGKEQDVWIKDLAGGPPSRLTFGEAAYTRPAWSADGREVLYVSGASGRGRVYRKSADGSGPASVLLDSVPNLWSEVGQSRDGRWLLLRTFNDSGPASQTGGSVVRTIYARGTGSDSLIAVPSPNGDTFGPALSPDGRWLAYAGMETGHPEVYVRPFPNLGDGKYQISVNGGTEPVWANSGRELFYVDVSNQLVVASVATVPSFAVIRRQPLFSVAFFNRDLNHQVYAVSPDDQKFLMIQNAVFGSGDLVQVENWLDVLKAKLKR